MRTNHLFLLLFCTLPLLLANSGVTWAEIPSVRAGQIEAINTLMTSADTAASQTDHTFTYFTAMNANATSAALQCGATLMSYESWMTKDFAFNISVQSCSSTASTVRFLLYEETYFAKAKVHFITIWRDGANNDVGGYYNMECIYGCYFTNTLITDPYDYDRNETLPATQSSTVAASAADITTLVVKPMIAGLELYNILGLNQQVKITSEWTGTNLTYTAWVEKNNKLKFFCVSTLVYDGVMTLGKDYYVIQYADYALTGTNTGLKTITYQQRYDGLNRMIFGISEFNITMSNSRYLNVQSSNISLIAPLYLTNYAMQLVAYHTFFLAYRECTDSTHYYDPASYTCVVDAASCPNNSIATVAFKLCDPCHYSCATCSTARSSTACDSCNDTYFRTQSGNSCPCDTGYVDNGNSLCALCNQTLVGCAQCSDVSTCVRCDSDPTRYYVISNVTNTCDCSSGYYMASGYCLSYPGCSEAQYFNNIIACKSCNSATNFILQTSNDSCICNYGYFLTNVTCTDTCGDGITAVGKCDDGNTADYDGCDSTCAIENGYHCSYQMNGTTPGISTCVLKQSMSVTYLYSQRMVDSNQFKMGFQLSPSQSGLSSSSFDGQFVTNMPVNDSSYSLDPDKFVLYLEGTYMQALEGGSYSGVVTFNNMSFYADPVSFSFNPHGLNAKLVMETMNSTNSVMGYIVMGVAIFALVLAIFASVVGLKLVGIELLVPIQLFYFTLSTIQSRSTYLFWFGQLKFANGYNSIIEYDYTRTYKQSKNLIGINYQTEFLLSTNIFLALYVVSLIWLLIHHLRIKYKEYKLESFLEENELQEEERQRDQDEEEEREGSEQERRLKTKVFRSEELQMEESKLREDHHYSLKIFSFEVDRAYFTLYFILFNQIVFAFVVMTHNLPVGSYYFPQAYSILACNFLFFFFVGNLVFIYYDQETNKVIAFTCIKDRYAYLYLLTDVFLIIFLAMTFRQDWATYPVTVLSVVFIVLIVVEKPYSSVFFSFENIVALYLHVMLSFSLVLLCLVNAGQDSSEQAQLSYSYIILGLICVGEILTAIRIALKVNFKKAFDDLKNPNDDEDKDQKKKRVLEKNLDLLYEQEHVEIIPPESVRNGLLTPKDRMIDWESKNTDEFESIRQKESVKTGGTGPGEAKSGGGEYEENSDSTKITQLEVLKRRLRNNLKLKREKESETTRKKE